MKIFMVLRYGTSCDTKVEKEDVVEAECYEIRNGTLCFYDGPLSSFTTKEIAVYGWASWIKVTERREPQ
jgi:hypothetical protein